MNGYDSHTNVLGFRAIRIHYSASPRKNRLHPDPEIAEQARKWYENAQRMYPDPLAWQQEMEISWWVAAGTRVYPEFNETLHCLDLEGYRGRKVVYRAWDFGYLAPACLIAQIDTEDRLVVLKEIIGKEEITRTFAQRVLDHCARWFPDHTAGFRDFCDPAGQKVSANASEASEVRDVEVLGKLGIFPSWEYGWTRASGRSLVHQLLQIRENGTPSMYINRLACPILLQGFLGKYVYPQRKDGTAHNEPDEACHPWADVHAALRYLATGLYNVLGLRKGLGSPPPSPQPPYHGYGTPVQRRSR